jgi:hypothetical protein
VGGADLPARYAVAMSNELETQPNRSPSVAKKALAGLVIVVVAALAVKVVIGLILSVFWIIIGVAAVVAVLWALKTIVW